MPRKPGKRDAQTDTRRDARGAAARTPAPKAKREAPQGPSQRQLRVAEEVRHALSAVFMREEFHDPDIAGLKSMSLNMKMQMQWERNYERLVQRAIDQQKMARDKRKWFEANPNVSEY